ncbi:MAG: PAS domain S-box protein, partial [Blastocatellia bacterium]
MKRPHPLTPYPVRNFFAYLKADSRRAYLSYAWSTGAMLAALAATYWARTPRQQAPFLFVASVEVVIAVTWGFGPGTVSALIAVAGMRVLFGEPLYSLVVFFSVSALVGIVSERRKRGDVTLNRQALIFANLTEAIIITDLSRRILDVNPAAEMMFGYTKDDLIGVSVA